MSIGFIYTLIVIQAGKVVGFWLGCMNAGGSNLLVDSGRKVFGVVVRVVDLCRPPVNKESSEAGLVFNPIESHVE